MFERTPYGNVVRLSRFSAYNFSEAKVYRLLCNSDREHWWPESCYKTVFANFCKVTIQTLRRAVAETFLSREKDFIDADKHERLFVQDKSQMKYKIEHKRIRFLPTVSSYLFIN